MDRQVNKIVVTIVDTTCKSDVSYIIHAINNTIRYDYLVGRLGGLPEETAFGSNTCHIRLNPKFRVKTTAEDYIKSFIVICATILLDKDVDFTCERMYTYN